MFIRWLVGDLVVYVEYSPFILGSSMRTVSPVRLFLYTLNFSSFWMLSLSVSLLRFMLMVFEYTFALVGMILGVGRKRSMLLA